MREYYLDSSLCTVSINPKKSVDLAGVDVLVITSPETREDIALVLMAMADGIPVILPRTNVTINVVANGITGVLYGADDELYLIIEYLVVNPMLREEIGAASRNLFDSGADINELVSIAMEREIDEDADA